MGGSQQSLVPSNSKTLLDIHFEDAYSGGREYSLCFFSPNPLLSFLISHAKHLSVLLNLSRKQLLDSLILYIFCSFYFIDFHVLLFPFFA